MKPDVVVFDLDDTLLVQEDLNKELLLALMKELGAGEKAPEVLKFFQDRARDLWNSLESAPVCRNLGISAGEGLWGDFDGPQPGMALLREEALVYRQEVWKDLPFITPVDAGSLAQEYYRRRRALVRWLPGAKEVLDRLKGKVHLALLTNGASDLQWYKIRSAGVDAWFDTLVVSGDEGVGKPHPGLFRKLVEKCAPAGKGIPKNFLMVGNNYRSDIRGAQEAGMPAVWLDWEGETLPPELTPWKIIKRLEELPGLIGF